MEKIPARTGWLWLKQGFALFRQQPGALSTLFLGYMLLMLLAGLVPLLGELMPVILVPVFGIAFMQASADIDQKKRVLPKVLLSGFHQPALVPLLSLGLLYLATAAVAIAASTLVDDGTFWQLVSGQIEPTSPLLKKPEFGGAILLFMAFYVPCLILLWFAAPLIYWQQMSVGKAVFYSVVAVLRSYRAFLVLCAAWFAISVFISKVVTLIFGISEGVVMLMAPLSVVLTVVMHCSFYASYRQLFGRHYGTPVSLDKKTQ